jgi:WD40 repeat protein
VRLHAVSDLHVLPHQWSLGMGIDPSGRFLIADSEPARLWDTMTGRCCLTLADFSADTVNWAFSDGGNTLITGGRGRHGRLWDCASGRLIRELRGHWRSVATGASH